MHACRLRLPKGCISGRLSGLRSTNLFIYLFISYMLLFRIKEIEVVSFNYIFLFYLVLKNSLLIHEGNSK